jgi:hypothetical protein
MYPASTKQGAAVLAFPDVCKTPTPAGPIPVPYPNAQATPLSPTQKTQLKVGPGTGTVQSRIGMSRYAGLKPPQHCSRQSSPRFTGSSPGCRVATPISGTLW